MTDAKWPSDLGSPILPMESVIRQRAQSILTTAGNPGPLLPYEQARDVVAWHESQLRRTQPNSLAVKAMRLFNPFHNFKRIPQ